MPGSDAEPGVALRIGQGGINMAVTTWPDG